MKRNCLLFYLALCGAPFLAAFCQMAEGVGEAEAETALGHANALWEREKRSAAELSEIVRICESLLARRESLQKTARGKALLGKTYYLLGQAYGEQHAAGASGAAQGAHSGTVKTLLLPGGAPIEMIYCEPGEFMMGSPQGEEGRDADEIQHRVTLTKGYWLSKYEVTQGQWESVMGRNPAAFKGNSKMPVDNVSWNDCRKFVAKINEKVQCGARLPTEAEWEYACRAGTTTAYFWGNSLNGTQANCNGDFPCATRTRGPYLRRPTNGGRYAANPWGFCDMHGNMYEWCEDKCGEYSTEDAVDPVSDSGGKCRVLRGGCWYFGARFCRSANRIKNNASYADAFTGFRLCCNDIP